MIGATGRYPNGRYGAADEGELLVALTVDHGGGRIVLDFGKSVLWLAMTAADADALAVALLDKADALRNGPGATR